MRSFWKLFGLSITLLLWWSCNKRINDTSVEEKIQIPAYGSENTLEIVSWNIEQFPMHPQTISNVKEIILDLDADIYALQEIDDPFAFQLLLDSLSSVDSLQQFRGRLNSRSTNLRTAVIFKNSLVTVLSEKYLFVDDENFVGRPPLELHLSVQGKNQLLDFKLIVLHLKAFDSAADRRLRHNAIRELNEYLNLEMQNGRERDFVVAGDWNDLLNDPESENIFLPFLQDSSTYRFLTKPFKGSGSEFSYIGGNFNSLIDHIMITTFLDSSFEEITARVIKVDQFFNGYLSQVSDHRPVGSKYAIF